MVVIINLTVNSSNLNEAASEENQVFVQICAWNGIGRQVFIVASGARPAAI